MQDASNFSREEEMLIIKVDVEVALRLIRSLNPAGLRQAELQPQA